MNIKEWMENEDKKDAIRYKWLSSGGLWVLPYKDSGMGPEFDLSPEAIDPYIEKEWNEK